MLYLCNARHTFAMLAITLQYTLYPCNTCYTFALHAMPLQHRCTFMSVCIPSFPISITQTLHSQKPSSPSQCHSLISNVTDHRILFFFNSPSKVHVFNLSTIFIVYYRFSLFLLSLLLTPPVVRKRRSCRYFCVMRQDRHLIASR
jgi:hypothetical protein